MSTTSKLTTCKNTGSQLAIGLGMSCVLLGLACTLIWRQWDEYPHHDIDSAGILQLTWLVGNEAHLRRLATPTETVLRKSGMFEVDLGETLRRKALHANQSDYGLVTLRSVSSA